MLVENKAGKAIVVSENFIHSLILRTSYPILTPPHAIYTLVPFLSYSNYIFTNDFRGGLFDEPSSFIDTLTTSESTNSMDISSDEKTKRTSTSVELMNMADMDVDNVDDEAELFALKYPFGMDKIGVNLVYSDKLLSKLEDDGGGERLDSPRPQHRQQSYEDDNDENVQGMLIDDDGGSDGKKSNTKGTKSSGSKRKMRKKLLGCEFSKAIEKATDPDYVNRVDPSLPRNLVTVFHKYCHAPVLLSILRKRYESAKYFEVRKKLICNNDNNNTTTTTRTATSTTTIITMTR